MATRPRRARRSHDCARLPPVGARGIIGPTEAVQKRKRPAIEAERFNARMTWRRDGTAGDRESPTMPNNFTTADSILTDLSDQLEKSKLAGDKLIARCPAHDDKTRHCQVNSPPGTMPG